MLYVELCVSGLWRAMCVWPVASYVRLACGELCVSGLWRAMRVWPVASYVRLACGVTVRCARLACNCSSRRLVMKVAQKEVPEKRESLRRQSAFHWFNDLTTRVDKS